MQCCASWTLRTKGADCQGLTSTSELQWPSGTIWNKNSPTKYYTQNCHIFHKTYLFKPIMLGACSISIVYPWYSLVFFGVIQLPEIFPYFGKYPGSTICRCNSVPRHPWDRSLCFESERLHKLHMRSSAASPAVLGVLGLFFLGGGGEFQWWIDGISMVYPATPSLGQHKSGLKFALPSWSIYEFPQQFSIERFAHVRRKTGPHPNHLTWHSKDVLHKLSQDCQAVFLRWLLPPLVQKSSLHMTHDPNANDNQRSAEVPR